MAEGQRNPRNAPGPFYVLNDQCISCGAPQGEAPGLVTLDDEVGCYFHKQPETDDEVNDAIRAVLVSCVEAYRYGGTDPVIRRRLAELGYSRACDLPLEGHPVVIRNRARFSLATSHDATELAKVVLSWFEPTWTDGRCTKPVVGDADHAEFEFTHSEKYGTPRTYTIDAIKPAASHIPPSIYRDPSSARVWLLTEGDQKYPPIWLHDVLTKNGAVQIRWFSRDEWTARGPGSDLPY